jgi:hypothetical protein
MAHIIWLTSSSQQTTTTQVPQRPGDGVVCQNLRSEGECQISEQKLQEFKVENDKLEKLYAFLQTEKWDNAWALVLRLRAGDSLESLCQFVETRTR